jgi:MerR family transcriptional regulator, light-induced transcriptional regulator
MNSFSIKDLENLSGIKAHTIRIWEQRYALLKPSRTDTNIRFYDNDELKNLLNVALLNKYGFKISHITKMSSNEMREKIVGLTSNEAQQERLIVELIQCMVDMDMDSFNQSLAKQIAIKGIEKVIMQTIFPFLERIGILWQTDNISPAHEHLVTNIIRQKLIVGIDYANPYVQSKKSVLLFMPEYEHHEIGLLFVHFLMKSRGIQTVYLGANTPIKDLPVVLDVKKPDIIYTHITSLSSHHSYEKFVSQCKMHLANTELYVSGNFAQNYNKALPSNFHLMKTVQQVIELINKID